MSTTNTDQTSSKVSKSSSSCNNKIGRNQYKDRPAPDDPHVSQLLRDYHAKGITDRTQVSKLLLDEHGITLGESSISRRKRKLGLKASHLTTLELDVTVKRQLILDQMAKDPKGRLGARMVKQGILRDTGIHLTRDYIREEMRNLDPVGHAARGPAHVKAKRQQKQLAVQNSGSTELSGRHPGLNSIHPSTEIVPLRIPSGSNPRFHLNPVPLPPITHLTSMDVDVDEDEDEDENTNSCDIDQHLNSSDEDDEIPDQPNTLSYPNANLTPEVDPHLLPDTVESQAVVSPSMTAALDILRNIAPRMAALAQALHDIDLDQELLDVQAHHLVTGGMETAAFLERQLAKVASKAHCHRP